MNRKNDRNGMTLIELLIAMVILSFALIPVADLLMKNSRQTRFSTDRLIAATRVRMVLDRFRSHSADQLAQMFPIDGTGAVDADPLLALPGDEVSGFVDFLTPLEDSDRDQVENLRDRFSVQVRFIAEPDGRSGQLIAKVNWSAVTGSSDRSHSASEWISERSRN